MLVATYLKEQFNKDIEKYNKTTLSTGFKALDEKLDYLRPGVYVLGATTSLGKTTFVHQIADQVAEQGNYVAYFSLEMPPRDLVSKSIIRTMTRIVPEHTLSNRDIIRGVKENRLYDCAKEYYLNNSGKRMEILFDPFGIDLDAIDSFLDKAQRNNVLPKLVVIDYLQVLSHKDLTQNATGRVSQDIKRLKQIQIKYDIIAIVISSLNRANYSLELSLESFKETGDIEYTADGIWGLQLSVLRDDDYKKEKNISIQREILDKAKAEMPRKITFKALKNRGFKPVFDLDLVYDPSRDIFYGGKEIDLYSIANIKKKCEIPLNKKEEEELRNFKKFVKLHELTSCTG